MTDAGAATVLITGASGLIGGRLVEALRADGSLRVRAASRTARPWPQGVQGVVTDGSADALARACDGCDAVVNLAAMPEAACASDPAGALRVNTGGTLALGTAAARAGVRRLVQMSTAKVYGGNFIGTVTEATPTQPASHYAITHRASEDYAALHGNAVVFRLANGFGAPAGRAPHAWSVIVNDCCRQAVTARRIVLNSDGRALRDFVSMDDVTAAIRGAIGALPPGTYNLGSGRAVMIRDMAEHVASLAGDLLGTAVAVEVHGGGTGERAATAPLDFRIDRLAAAGITPASAPDTEILRTLRAALATFDGGADG